MIWQLAFCLICSTVLVAPFLPALIEWREKTDAAPLRVVREQDTNIRYFAHSFRDQISDFFDRQQIDVANPPGPCSGEFRPGERFLFLGLHNKPAWPEHTLKSRSVEFLIIGLDDVLLEGNLVFQQEIYCNGKLYGGSNSTFRAVYAGTDLILGTNSIVARWLHSQGHVHVGANSRLFGRVSSGSSITLAAGTSFERLNARLIRFAADNLNPIDALASSDRRQAWSPGPELTTLDDTTRLHTGVIEIPAESTVDYSLIAQKELLIGANARVTGSLKAYKRLRIGRGSVIRGAVVCQGPIEIERGCIVKGPVISEKFISLASGCIIGTPALPTTMTAPRIMVGPGSQVSGTIWASKAGEVRHDEELTEADIT